MKNNGVNSEPNNQKPERSIMKTIIDQVKAAQADEGNVRNAVTVYEQIRERRELEHELTVFYTEDDKDEQQKTIGLAFSGDGNQPVVGWLVCELGPERGRSYVIRNGRNFLGRSYGSDIIISDDPLISSTNHCSIIFEPQKCCFYIYPSENGVTRLNGEVLKKERIITDEDTVAVGKSVFRMIPYCKEGRVWK